MKSYFKNLIKKHIRDPRRNKKGVFTYYGHDVFFPKDSIIFNRAMSDGGIYELENLRLIQQFLKPATTIFDVGANIGLMAIPLLWNNKDINVISVEASPNSLDYLNKTHASSPFRNRWTIIDKAVANEPGVVDFYLSQTANGALDGLKNTERTAIIKTIEIDCTTIDIIWAGLSNPQVSFIKIDIEGADLLALKGGLGCINTCRPVILMEWNQTNIKAFKLDNYELIKFVDEIGYEIYYLPEVIRVTSQVELTLLNNKKFVENYLLIPAEKRD